MNAPEFSRLLLELDACEGKISKEELRAAAADAYTAADAADAAYTATAYAAAAAYASDTSAAKEENHQLTADICRTYIGDELKKLIKEREGKQ